MFNEVSEIFVVMTRNCNMKCSYCYQEKESKVISFDAIDRLIEFIKENKFISRILLFGGEPYLEIDKMNYFLDKLIELKKETNRTIYVGSISNGIIYNDKVKSFLEKVSNNFEFYYIVSIDGNKETHDINRRTLDNKPTYDIVMNTLKSIEKDIPKVHLSYHSVVPPNIIDKFYEASKTLIRNPKLSGGSFKYLSRIYTWQQYTVEDFEKIYKSIKRLNEEGYSVNKLLSVFEPLMSTIDYRYNNLYRHQEFCVHGKESVLIDYDGKIYPCTHYLTIKDEEKEKFYMYDLFKGYNTHQDNIFKKIERISNEYKDKCKNCSSFTYCYVCSAALDISDKEGMKTECQYNKMLNQAAKNVNFILK